MKLWRMKFKVEGTGQFPIDMLRYDRAIPVDAVAFKQKESYGYRGVGFERGRRQIALYVEGRTLDELRITYERWRSFMWFVVKGSEEAATRHEVPKGYEPRKVWIEAMAACGLRTSPNCYDIDFSDPEPKVE